MPCNLLENALRALEHGQKEDRVSYLKIWTQSLSRLELNMPKKQYRPWNPDQMVLFPPAVKDALDEGHIVFRIMDVVETLDIRCITNRMEEKQA